jgi:hypothetical protein
MIGGLITIATLTGVGAAATGIGVGVGSAEDTVVVEQGRRLAVEELAKVPISALRNAVAGVLAVVDAQRRLRFESTGDLVEDMLNAALDIIRAECGLHEAIAPAPEAPGQPLPLAASARPTQAITSASTTTTPSSITAFGVTTRPRK